MTAQLKVPVRGPILPEREVAALIDEVVEQLDDEDAIRRELRALERKKKKNKKLAKR